MTVDTFEYTSPEKIAYKIEIIMMRDYNDMRWYSYKITMIENGREVNQSPFEFNNEDDTKYAVIDYIRDFEYEWISNE